MKFSCCWERFIRTLKSKIYIKIAYLGYLNKLVDEYNNSYHRSIGKKPIDANYSALTEVIQANSKWPKFKVDERVRISKYKNILAIFTLKVGQYEYFDWFCVES